MVATRPRTNGIQTKQKHTRADYADFAHIGPGTLAGSYLRETFWHPIYRSDRIKAGHAKPVRLLGEDFTLFRGETGTPHVLAFRCAHRGMQLSPGWIEGDCIRCFYHGWKYDGSGQCVEQPAEPKPFSQKVKIPDYPTRDYLGLIFTYLGEGEPPPFPRYADFEDFEGVLDLHSGLRKCNFFNNAENGLDPAHVAYVHRGLEGSIDGFVNSLTMELEETDWGIRIGTKWSGGMTNVTQFGMPYMKHSKALPKEPEVSGYTEFLTFKVPVDDENHIQYLVLKYPMSPDKVERYWELREARLARWTLPHVEVADDILVGRLRREDVDPETTEMVRVQDDVSQVGQGVIADRTNERLGPTDAGVIMVRKIYARELKAFAEGRPVKRWTYDPEAQRSETFRAREGREGRMG